jgi:flagellar basal body P-ring protein FlgI
MSNYQLTHSASDIDAAITKQVNSVSDLNTAAGNTNFPTSSAVDNYINSQLPAIQTTIDAKVVALSNAVMNNARGFNGEHSKLSPQTTPSSVINENTTGVPLFVSYVVSLQAEIHLFKLDISNNNFSSFLTIWESRFDSAHTYSSKYHTVTAKGIVPPGYKWRIYADAGFVSSSSGAVYKDIANSNFLEYTGSHGHHSFKLQ